MACSIRGPMVYDVGPQRRGILLGLVIYDLRDPQCHVFAERGAFADTCEGPRLVLVNVSSETVI